MTSIRLIVAYASISLFIIYALLSGLNERLAGTFFNTEKFPDFGVYRPLDVLAESQFPLDDPDRRVIIVGDIHGMHDQLQSLLHKLSYDSRNDVLVSIGDIIAKGPHKGSMQALEYMASNNVTAVRGNHCQTVIEWRSWLVWMRSLSGGSEFVESVYSKWLKAKKNGAEAELWVDKLRKHDKRNRKWWRRVPRGWVLFGDHFEIAYAMTDAHYAYMVSKPLKLHIPHAHTFIAHAGILSSDPRYKPWHENQPLAKIPSLDVAKSIPLLRKLQEAAILSDVPQNNDPWVTTNMRSVVDQKVTRGKEGTPWSELYNQDMDMCNGFSSASNQRSLPCYPATVVYGHAASRGLDIKRWTVGLDTGCVYENRLSALVLGGPNARLDENWYQDDEVVIIDPQAQKSHIKFGDRRRAEIVSVSCS